MATLVFDAYKGWSSEKLKRKCRRLAMVIMEDEMIILALASGEKLQPTQQMRVDRLIKAYED